MSASATKVSFDSNVVLYLVKSDVAKTAKSADLIGRGGLLSVQVLNECASVLLRKTDMTWAEINEFLAALMAKCAIVPITLETHVRALRYAERYRLSLYDSLLVAAAVLQGCTTLYSEDMHGGLVIDGLTIRNPFRQP